MTKCSGGLTQLSKYTLGAGISSGQKLHALGNPKRRHADKPLARRGLLFCTVLGSLRQRASIHIRPRAQRRQPGSILWERAKDRAEAPSNLCGVIDVIKEAPEVWLPLGSHVWSREPV